jgi:tetratricopeptide (TPR) repeat protein
MPMRDESRRSLARRRTGRVASVVGAVLLGWGATAAADDDPGRLPFDPGSTHVQWMGGSSDVASALAALDRGERRRAIGHAEAALDQSLSRDDRLAALNALCVAHVADERPSAAMPYCDRVVAETWGDWRALNNRGNALLALGDLKGAIRDYERALDALDAVGREQSVRHYGRAGWQSGRDTLVANLALARERFEADWQLARMPAPPLD